MSSLLDSATPPPRRTMHLFFMVDTSGSMGGSKIGAVNDAIRNVLPIAREISTKNADAEIKIAAMTFSDGFEWLYNEAKSTDDFEWIDQTASGGTDLGEACRNMEKVLHANGGWMSSASGSYAPVFILLSDGGPTDNFESGMAVLRNNPWFSHGIKTAIAIGEDADNDVLAKFTGNIERVIRVHDVETLKNVVRLVSVTSMEIGSKSTSLSSGGKDMTKEEEFTKTVNEQVKNNEKINERVEIRADVNSCCKKDDF